MVLQALLELNVQNDEEFEMLSEEFKSLLQDKQNIEEKFSSVSSNLNRLNGILIDIYVNKYKFKGIAVKNKLEPFMDVLKSDGLTEDELLEAFNSSN
jgi:Bardet-Biedl syndrome 7 protein